MGSQLANEFFTWLFILFFFIADTAFFGYALSSKNCQAKIRKSVHSEENWNILHGFMWLGLFLGIIACVIVFCYTSEAYSAWEAYQNLPSWRR